MPVRVADSLKQQNDLDSFPVAYGLDIWLDKNKSLGTPNYKSIQKMYEDGELGGGGSGSGLPEPTDVDQLLISYKDENNELRWKQIDKSEVSGAGYKVVTDIDKEIGITQDTRVILTENQSITLPTVDVNPQNKIGVKVTVMASGRGCSFCDGSTVFNVPERSYADVLWDGEKWIYGKALAIWV